jgi:hypothetical protein
MFVALTTLGSGCSGINASKTVSPLDFILPGGGGFLKIDPPTTNTPVFYPGAHTEVAVLK